MSVSGDTAARVPMPNVRKPARSITQLRMIKRIACPMLFLNAASPSENALPTVAFGLMAAATGTYININMAKKPGMMQSDVPIEVIIPQRIFTTSGFDKPESLKKSPTAMVSP